MGRPIKSGRPESSTLVEVGPSTGPESQDYFVLCEEACKSWQYAFTSEFVYFDQPLEVLGDSRSIPTDTYSKGRGVMEIGFVLIRSSRSFIRIRIEERIMCRT